MHLQCCCFDFSGSSSVALVVLGSPLGRSCNWAAGRSRGQSRGRSRGQPGYMQENNADE